MSKYKTALGRTVDMAALAAKNEHVRAVGNQKVNARGDTIDSMGRVTQSVTSKVNSGYVKTVGNRGARAQPSNPQKVAADPVTKVVEIAEFKPDVETTEAEDVAIEAIKAKDVATAAIVETPVTKSKTKETSKK